MDPIFIASVSTIPQSPALPFLVVSIMAIVLIGLLISVILLTMGRSIQQYWHRKRTNAVRDELRTGLLERLYDTGDPGWDDWVETLSERECIVLESLLETFLRELDGDDAELLGDLGSALGINDRARMKLKKGDEYERLNALTWLALLKDPPDGELLEKYCTGTPRERAAAARVLYVSDHPAIASLGVDLMLRDLDGAFSVFGIDTLYRVAEADPSPLFRRAAADYEDWNPALQQQVLLVTRHVQTVVGSADLSWVVDLLSSPEERTRIEAARTLGGYGWRDSLRDTVAIEAISSDPSPKVRANVYRMLAEWGDSEALTTLEAAAAAEEDDRARVTAAESLIRHRDPHTVTVAETLKKAWEWAAANAAIDELIRDVSSPSNSNE